MLILFVMNQVSATHHAAHPIRRVRTNKNAATLAFLTLGMLIPGLTLPFVHSSIVGEERTYSVLTGIGRLYLDGNIFLAIVILVFSVIFPFVKAVFLLTATSSFIPLGRVGRARLAHLAITTGKYSLLDLLVVALLIVIVQVDGLAKVEPRIGTVFFGLSVFLAMLAGLCIHFPDRTDNGPKVEEVSRKQRRNPTE